VENPWQFGKNVWKAVVLSTIIQVVNEKTCNKSESSENARILENPEAPTVGQWRHKALDILSGWVKMLGPNGDCKDGNFNGENATTKHQIL